MTSLAANLPDVVEHAHDEARTGLDGDRAGLLDAIAWLSAHLAAVAHAVHPVAVRRLPDGRFRVAALRRAERPLHRMLWLLDRRLTGDARTARSSVPHLLEHLRAQVAVHEELEHALLADLVASLDAETLGRLTSSYADALAVAPTRPHPHSLGFHVDGALDGLRNTLDGRHAPEGLSGQDESPARGGAFGR